MKRIALVLLAGLWLTGCSLTPEHDMDLKKSSEANAELGLRYMLQGRNDVALEKLKRAVEQNPDSAIAHHYLAELYRRLGEDDDADKHYRESVSLDPDNSSAANNYGVFLCGRKQYEKAEKQFEAVLKNPVYAGRAQTLENMGLCWHDAKDDAKAEEYFRKALQLDPKLPVSLLSMAEIVFYQGKALSARAYLQRYSEIAPHTPQSLWIGVRIERILGDTNAMSSYGMLLKNKFPDSAQTRLYMKTIKR